MTQDRACRRCLLLESGREDVLASIHEHIARLPERDRAAQEVYRQRLDACKACEHLIGGTCFKCGCYPEFRAAFRTQKCPIRLW